MTTDPPLAYDTPRLAVRPVTEADLSDLAAVYGDQAVTRYLPFGPWTRDEDARVWMERVNQRHAQRMAYTSALVLRDSGQVVGTCMLFNYSDIDGRAELGYVLGQAHWGQGLMGEAITGLIAHAFGPGGLRRLEAETDARHHTSQRVLLGRGFVQEGRRVRRWLSDDGWADSFEFGLLRPGA